jgi:serine-type D-Ala-D-Ala endopeptidase (penicillin-binding protein 7)
VRITTLCVTLLFALGAVSNAAAQSAQKAASPKAQSTKAAKPPAKSRQAAAPAKRANHTPRANGTRALSAAAPALSSANGKSAPAPWPEVKSNAALVLDATEGRTIYAKNENQISAIASITKLMTAMVVLDTGQPLDELVQIGRADVDTLKGTGSRLRIGSTYTRRDLLHMALMSSENRAASALGRAHPGGLEAFVERMNARAVELGMHKTRFVDPTGLSAGNVSTAEDLAVLVKASLDYELIREFSTTPSAEVQAMDSGQVLGFNNSNGLVRSAEWRIDLSKTGYISEAGRCLVMHATIATRPVIIVLLDSWGLYTRIGDANRIKRWMEGGALRLGHSG